MARIRHSHLLFLSVCLLLAGTGGSPRTAWAAEAPKAQTQAVSGAQTQAVPGAQTQAVSGAATIQYASLADLVKAHSPQVQTEKAQYESRLDRYGSARDEIAETRRHLLNEADDMEKNGNHGGAVSYRAQAKVLEKSVQSMDKQIKTAKGSSATMSLRQMEDTVTWTAQNLMGTYNTLKAAREGAAADAELMESRHEKTVHQTALGMVSQAQADAAEKASTDAANKVRSLKDEMEQIRKEILAVTGYPADSQVQIGPMPVPDQSRMDQINLDADKWRAMGNNYGLRQQRGNSSGGTIKEHHVRQRAVNQSESAMYGQMDTLYQNLQASRSAWQSACTAQEAREAEWKAASSKKDLGMLSDQDYLKAKSAYLNGTAAKIQADVSFQQALDTYAWAVKGLIK